jgi:hypothetical protein
MEHSNNMMVFIIIIVTVIVTIIIIIIIIIITYKAAYKSEHTAMGIHCADHATPFYPQKFALTSPTSGGRSVGIVRSRTQATQYSIV